MSKDKENVFEDVKVDEEITTTEVDKSSQEIPSMLDPGWNDYVMSLFEDDELFDQDSDPKPVVAGLRRVAEMLLGEIVVSGPTQVFPPTEKDHPGRATVVYTIQFENGKVFSEVADSWYDNTDDKFVVYNTAMASTRAEARALRKALRIRAVSAEEVTSKDTAKAVNEAVAKSSSSKSSDGEFKEESPLSQKQDSFINVLCDRAEVDREKFFKIIFDVEDNKKLSKRIASEAIDKLDSYAGGRAEVPEEVKK